MKFSASAGEYNSQLEINCRIEINYQYFYYLIFGAQSSSKFLAMKILINARHANYLSELYNN